MLSRFFKKRSNVDLIDAAREYLDEGMDTGLLTQEHEIQAIRELRRQVPGLTLLDAVTLIRRALDESTLN